MRGIKTKESGQWRKPVIFLVLLLVFGALLNSVSNVYKKKKMADKALARMGKEVSELKKRGEFLEELLGKLTTKEGLSFEMRRKLNVAEEGENVAIIVEGEKTTSTQNLETSPWQKLKFFFIGLFK